MIWFGRTGKGENGKLWHRIVFWSLLFGAIGIALRIEMRDQTPSVRNAMLHWHLDRDPPTSGSLAEYVAGGMILGAIARWFVHLAHQLIDGRGD
jgi:hypothetical protein